MNTRLLRLAKKDTSEGIIRRWYTDKGMFIAMNSQARHFFQRYSSYVAWPSPTVKRGARFDWHHAMIKEDIRKVLSEV